MRRLERVADLVTDTQRFGSSRRRGSATARSAQSHGEGKSSDCSSYDIEHSIRIDHVHTDLKATSRVVHCCYATISAPMYKLFVWIVLEETITKLVEGYVYSSKRHEGIWFRGRRDQEFSAFSSSRYALSLQPP